MSTDEEINDGELVSGNKVIQIKRGVPVFLDDHADNSTMWNREQDKTTVTFSEKWKKFQSYGLGEKEGPFLFEWYCKKFGLKDIGELKNFYKNKKKVLELGPGSGFNTRFMGENSDGYIIAADISEGAYVTYNNCKGLENVHAVQADLMDLPFEDNSFDFIIADGVLHHTPNTYEAIKCLYNKLETGGQFFFYLYKKMSPVKQYIDSYIRQEFSGLTAEECFKACEAITDLGRELSKIEQKIILESPIPILGIPAGEHSVQRLIYYNFVKCFWNDAFDYDTNNMVNFDWYHPHNAWQHTEEEVR